MRHLQAAPRVDQHEAAGEEQSVAPDVLAQVGIGQQILLTPGRNDQHGSGEGDGIENAGDCHKMGVHLPVAAGCQVCMFIEVVLEIQCLGTDRF